MEDSKSKEKPKKTKFDLLEEDYEKLKQKIKKSKDEKTKDSK